MKKCSKCKDNKPITDFYKKSRGKFGVGCVCKPCKKVQNKRYHTEEKERVSINKKKYYLDNRKEILKSRSEWGKSNPDKVNEISARKRKRKGKANLKSLSTLKQSQIREIYRKCREYREMGFNFQVDHIVPLNGKNVSGLHVPWNLQIVTAEYNLKKGNKYECN